MLSSQMERRVRERWDEICPLLLLHARCHAVNPLLQIMEWKALHAQRVEILLGRGVRLRKIRHWQWDDPRINEQAFGIILDKAIGNLTKRRKTIPPAGLAKFTRKRVPSTRTTQGDNDDRT
jgi:hypothetical protein